MLRLRCSLSLFGALRVMCLAEIKLLPCQGKPLNHKLRELKDVMADDWESQECVPEGSWSIESSFELL